MACLRCDDKIAIVNCVPFSPALPYICQDGGAVGFVDFTKLLFALSLLAQPLKRVRSISEHFFIVLSQRKACAGRFREETAGKRTGPITRWPLRRLLFTRLEIVFVTILPLPNERNLLRKCLKKDDVAYKL